MATMLIHNIDQKGRLFNRSLTIEYWKERVPKIFLSLFEDGLDQVVKKVIFQLDDTASSLITVYKEADEISVGEAKVIYPQVQDLRKIISKQNRRFTEIGYADSEEIEVKFNKLVHLANRLEAKVQKQIYREEEPESAPYYIKEKMKDNSRKAFRDAL